MTWEVEDLLSTPLRHVMDRLQFEDRGYSSPCWITTYVPNPGGYVGLQIAGKYDGLHRRSYEALVGPIPDGLHIDHLCRIRACMNPAHLEPVTPRENVLRSPTLSALNAQKTHCKRGHEFTPENTRIDLQRNRSLTARSCRTCDRIRNRQSKARRRRAVA